MRIVAEERERNVQEVWERSRQLLREAGVHPRRISDKILIPATSYASLDSDSFLRERWATLLARAQTPGTDDETLSLYVEVLRSLRSRDAQLLNAMQHSCNAGSWNTLCCKGAILGHFQYDPYTGEGPRVGDADAVFRVFQECVLPPSTPDVQKSTDGSDEVLAQWHDRSEFLISMEILKRLSLITTKSEPIVPAEWASALPPSDPNSQLIYYLTPFGVGFLAACTQRSGSGDK